MTRRCFESNRPLFVYRHNRKEWTLSTGGWSSSQFRGDVTQMSKDQVGCGKRGSPDKVYKREREV